MMMDEGKVFIAHGAYLAIIASCYRFANPAIYKNDWAEVQGALYGHNEVGAVHVQEAIPLAHLSHVAVEMREADYVALSSIEEKLASKGMFQVGWYHSHPDIKLMLSLEDVKTQAGLQKPNPLSIALVFNHVQLVDGEGDPGFKIFRLDDPSTIEIKYHEVAFEIAGADARELTQARIMLANVQKSFSGASAAERIIGRVEKTIKEMATEAAGLKEHLATLARQGNPAAVDEARAKHARRIEASFEKKASMARMQLEFLDYLELVERQALAGRITVVKQEWASFDRSFRDLLK
jgi:proteasome lid subunit RPN8/RPN11